MTGYLISAGAALVVALLTLVVVYAKRAGRQEAEAKVAKEQADAIQKANQELARPRTRKSVVGKLRDGGF